MPQILYAYMGLAIIFLQTSQHAMVYIMQIASFTIPDIFFGGTYIQARSAWSSGQLFFSSFTLVQNRNHDRVMVKCAVFKSADINYITHSVSVGLYKHGAVTFLQWCLKARKKKVLLRNANKSSSVIERFINV